MLGFEAVPNGLQIVVADVALSVHEIQVSVIFDESTSVAVGHVGVQSKGIVALEEVFGCTDEYAGVGLYQGRLVRIERDDELVVLEEKPLDLG